MMGFFDAFCVIFRAPPVVPELSASFSSFRALTTVSQQRLPSRTLTFQFLEVACTVSLFLALQADPQYRVLSVETGFFALFRRLKKCDTTSALWVGTASALGPMDASGS